MLLRIESDSLCSLELFVPAQDCVYDAVIELGSPGIGTFDLDVVSAPSLARVLIVGSKGPREAARMLRRLALEPALPALRTIEIHIYASGRFTRRVQAAAARLRATRGIEGVWLIQAPLGEATLTAQRI